MKTIIAGSRSLHNPRLVYDTIKQSRFDITEVFSGGAAGPDKWGELWAARRGIPVRVFIPDWARYGKAAGMIRNQEMAVLAQALIAVWDGESRGTGHMIATAKKLQLKMFVVNLGQGQQELVI